MLLTFRTAIALLLMSVLLGCAAPHREAGKASSLIANNGYVLITLQSDMQGVLPLKPDSFWGSPFFLGVGGEKHYLLSMKPGSYAFGGLTVGMSVGWDTYNNSPFTVEAGKVVYLGQHKFLRSANNKYSWEVRDALQESLAGLSPEAASEIRGVPIETSIPVKR